MKDLPENQKLKLVTIFSYTPNEAEIEEENNQDIKNLDITKKEFLTNVVKGYNNIFKTNFNVSSNFGEYYKDISPKIKEKKIDLLLVVNMFLTGFDAVNLNILFIGKELKIILFCKLFLEQI